MPARRASTTTAGVTRRGSEPLLEERWTIVEGRPLLYRTNRSPAPAGAPAIVHLHGFAIGGRYLLPTAEALAPHHPTYVPDLPGFGRSHKPPRSLDLTELADATARFMDAVGLEHAVLLGNSMGCAVTAEFAARHPARITAAVLCSPAGGPNNQPLRRALGQMLLDGPRENPRMLPAAASDYLRYGLVDAFRLFRALMAYPVVTRVERLALPVLVVAGDRDPLVNPARAHLIAQLPHVTIVFIDGAAHALNFSHPDELAHVVRCWLGDEPITDSPARGTVRVLLDGRDRDR
jgi:pimeloyl-ACP methyl ester carboxylesterase